MKSRSDNLATCGIRLDTGRSKQDLEWTQTSVLTSGTIENGRYCVGTKEELGCRLGTGDIQPFQQQQMTGAA